MWAAMKSTAEASSGCSTQAVPDFAGGDRDGLSRLTRWMILMSSSMVFSPRKIVSLPTTIASTLL